jgi:hypothetical protein
MTTVLTWGARYLSGVIDIAVTGYTIMSYHGSRG